MNRLTIKRDSWHYSFYKVISIQEPKHLCGYCWVVVFGAIILTLLIVLGTLSIGTVGWILFTPLFHQYYQRNIDDVGLYIIDMMSVVMWSFILYVVGKLVEENAITGFLSTPIFTIENKFEIKTPGFVTLIIKSLVSAKQKYCIPVDVE